MPLHESRTEDTDMKSPFATFICFLVLGFFLMASQGRTQAVQNAVPARPAFGTVFSMDTGK